MKKFLIFCLGAFVFGFGLAAAWGVLSHTAIGERIIGQAIEHAAGGDASFASLLEELIGLDRPRTYLVLFLNNTELRPGGGFIGSYGLGTISSGHLDLIKVEGTEIFDGHSDPTKLLDPPAPLADKLKVKKWFFRDSNWSPDFAVSAARTLDFYKREGGYLADQIDVVVGFTPTVIEEFLRVNGPITVDGFTFDEKNVTSLLQYQVEYGYRDQGITRDNRKSLLRDFSIALIKKAKENGLWNAKEYLAIGQNLLKQKQIMLYSPRGDVQSAIEKLGYAGRQSGGVSADYLQWVDANLGALKTDWALRRSLSYSLSPNGSGFMGTITMHYEHPAPRDWRTSRYISYTRVYLPLGTALARASFTTGGKTTDIPADSGTENGHAWFGVPINIAPQSSADLTFTVTTSPRVADAITGGGYTLAVDKELGTNNVALTLRLDFGRSVVGASPGENPKNFGDTRYDRESDLTTNRLFNVTLKN